MDSILFLQNKLVLYIKSTHWQIIHTYEVSGLFRFKKPVLPEKRVKKPAFNLPAGFFNKTWVFSSPDLDMPDQVRVRGLILC
jgi:hypothetical protein